jgi:hypothetical protein
MPAVFTDLCLDAGDQHVLAAWWRTAMGYVRRDAFDPPEDGRERRKEWPVPDVLADPQGDEFRVFTPR